MHIMHTFILSGMNVLLSMILQFWNSNNPLIGPFSTELFDQFVFQIRTKHLQVFFSTSASTTILSHVVENMYRVHLQLSNIYSIVFDREYRCGPSSYFFVFIQHLSFKLFFTFRECFQV